MSTGAARGLAEGLRRRGLAAPARLLLDAHRPLRPTLDDDRRFTELIEQLADAEHR
jgi:phage major head subunit gpT-like protein